MIKTEFYIAGGDEVQMSVNLDECTELCVIEGILYDCDRNTERWVKDKSPKYFTRRVIMQQKDYISADGITRRVIFSVGN